MKYLGFFLLIILLSGCSQDLLFLIDGHKPFRTSLGFLVYVPREFPSVNFKEHRFVRSKMGHKGNGKRDFSDVAVGDRVYIRHFGRSEDFGIVSYLEAYEMSEIFSKQAGFYSSFNILEVLRKRYSPAKNVWGICVWPSFESKNPVCLQQDARHKNRLIWLKRYENFVK